MAKNKTNTALKKIAQSALRVNYGFTTNSLSEITLLEASGDGTYILFKVADFTYRFDSILIKDTLLITRGTITQIIC